MTDEELGRAWAQKHEKRPSLRQRFVTDEASCIDHGQHYFWSIEGHKYDPPSSQVPLMIYDTLDCEYHPTEPAAYAALGSSLRRVVAFADGVKEVMG